MKCKSGFKNQSGRCVKKKSFFNSSNSKKSYNPFKMWGSYLGAVIILFFPLNAGFIGNGMLYEFLFSQVFVIGLIAMLFGFLIGWGIHSLIRKLRR